MTEPLDPKSVDLISQSEIAGMGINIRNGAAPAERGDDLLNRYIHAPNRLVIAYSSEDELLSDYIMKHWSALDGLSGEWCDIYPSTLQMAGGEDVYSAMADLQMLPGGKHLRIDALPIALLWSDLASACISLKEFSNSTSSLSAFFRNLFQYLRETGRKLGADDEDALRSILVSAFPKSRKYENFSFYVEKFEMNKHEYKADRGSVILGAGASARDISASYEHDIPPINLTMLADQLKQLRTAMKAEADDNDATHDVAIGQIATAMNAATAGKRAEVFAALKSAGEWTLGIAEKIGVGVATDAIKKAIG